MFIHLNRHSIFKIHYLTLSAFLSHRLWNIPDAGYISPREDGYLPGRTAQS
jgi:hypothetical protein